LEFSQQFNVVKNIAIFSDSLSSLTAITTGKSLCRPNTLNEIYDVVDSMNVEVKLIWIPSHLSIVGNEIVTRQKLEESLAYIFVADSMGLCSFTFCRKLQKRILSAPECVLAVQGHPKSMILVPIESAYATSY